MPPERYPGQTICSARLATIDDLMGNASTCAVSVRTLRLDIAIVDLTWQQSHEIVRHEITSTSAGGTCNTGGQPDDNPWAL
jgi:hypothetical protein